MSNHSQFPPQVIDFSSEWNWLSNEAHALAISKGWWLSPRSLLECMALVMSEIGEAVEAFRTPGCSKKILAFSHAEEELADIFIRLADMTCAFDLPVDMAIRARFPSLPGNGFSHCEDSFVVATNQAMARIQADGGDTHLNPLEHLAMAAAYLGEATFFSTQDEDDESSACAISQALFECMTLANEQNYNLAEAIIAKHRYNTARQFRHGGKLY